MGAPLSHRRPSPLPRFLYGASYYPEHWDAATRAEDPARMAAAGFTCVRMGEFAWHRFEPAEGRFDFGRMDEAIDHLAAVGIQTILGTPTAAPPRWLTRAHPEILRVDESGRPLGHGSRQHASHFHPVFREASRRITRALAAHYRDNPHVIGWQTDNEFHCHFAEDHSEAAQQGFREFLRRRYADDIDALNRAWGTDFWALAYRHFEDIETPRRDRPTHLNPSQVLDYHRCLSWAVTRFQREQIDILRAANPRWFITHNGCFASIDYRGDFTRDLDVLGYDSYPFFDSDPRHRAASHAFNLDHTRAYSGNFLVLEQQSGPSGQTGYLHDTPEPGEMRRMALASIAHGADALLFFRWRSCRFGAEEYWCGILDHDNVPRRRYDEAARLGRELRRLGPALLGSFVRIDLAIAGADFDSTYGHLALPLGLPGPRQAAESVHAFFFRRGHAVGIVHPADSLKGVRVFFVPHFPFFDAKWVAPLEAWVRAGGILVVGPRAGCKDADNQVVPDSLPGVLRVLTGTTVGEYGRQNRPDLRPLTLRLMESDAPTALWYEVLQPEEGTEVIGRWTSRHLSGSPAVTRRRLGRGAVFHVGTWLNDAVLEGLSSLLRRDGWLPSPHDLPEGIEVVESVHLDGRTLRFVINHRDEAVELAVSEVREDLLSGLPVVGTHRLEPNDVLVLAEGA